ncbi:transglutaminase family protein [Microlunatus panaciterrae]|uniref:Transglutaminase-like putative cysteine protease n=1 Tax=Microlunatus panaciterrae TaxID=400768 RepID=A0ABS2RHW6_9ACTN|nr:transglutaminase family protein [Microlunatus panaciterrae]MBM7798288.1 transglutaminase-like putative cysteine protease [Microlunatus panaciterrae]
MRRTVTAHLEVTLSGRTNLIYCIAAAANSTFERELLTISVDGTTVQPREIADLHGTRLHQLVADGKRVVLDYDCAVSGQADPPANDLDLITYLRPSRYCESDTLGPTAASEFSGLDGRSLLDAVTQWVADKLSYVAGSSVPTDGAVQTLLDRRGVCRDFAHLAIALLRALNVPARLAAVYAPGLSPMEFHAVAEAYVDGAWQVVDPTRMAPRQSMLRIATGRDAADTAFLTNHWATLTLDMLWVTAVVDALPNDDGRQLVQLR